MKLMILDGNSVINRAFYGVRLLTTKDGQYNQRHLWLSQYLREAHQGGAAGRTVRCLRSKGSHLPPSEV